MGYGVWEIEDGRWEMANFEGVGVLIVCQCAKDGGGRAEGLLGKG
jgi:hypothetical protein